MGKILIVDDQPHVRQQIKFLLTQIQQDSIEAEHGIEGLEQLKKNMDIYLMIIDLNMPSMDGITFLQEMQKDPKYEKIAKIMLTTETSPEIVKRGRELGIQYWMTKPWNDAHLLKVIEKILKKSKDD